MATTTMQEHTVHIPLVGIQLHTDMSPIGRVVLRKMEGAQFDALSQRVETIIRQSDGTAEEIEQLVLTQLPQILDSFRETVIAEFRMAGETEQAKTAAEAACRRTLDLLRYAIPVLYPQQPDVMVGIQGEVHNGARSRVTLAIADDGGRFTWQFQAVDTRTPFIISPDTIEAMTRLGIFEVTKILEKPDREWTDFENTLLDAIHWFANAQIEFELPYRLLSLITCLETFLTPQDGNPIGTAIAEGVAIIIGTTLDERKQLKKRVQKLYSMRSAVTHGGRKEVPDADVAELTTLAQTVIMAMIQRKDTLQDRDALLEWILEQKLAPAGKPA
jgi:hypothetical protein